MPPPDVSIVILTQRRPQGLRTAIRSVFMQAHVDFTALELVIVDNDRTPSAQPLVVELAATAPLGVVFVHEPIAGVATARNAGLAVARGRFIAFLDDDEEASQAWLAGLRAVQALCGADVVFGPVKARAHQASVTRRRYFEWFFSRHGPAGSGIIGHYYGCGNSLIRRAALPDRHAPFRVTRNHTGGEDDLLFGEMKAADKRFAWAAQAFVWEEPVPERLTLAYTIPRAFAYGQGPSSACAVSEPPNRLGVAGWMLVGVMQSVIFGPVAILKWLVVRKDRAEALDRAARALGKVLWWGPFKLRFYGRTD
ncbi:MAG TPA: glycosyltransferase family 2 protein [Caulobacteraceae bacterium]